MASRNAKRRHPSFKDLTGKTFGFLTVIGETGQRNGHILWLCRCVCGNHRTVFGHTLRTPWRAKTISCGCQRYELLAGKLTIHGYCRKGRRRNGAYECWIGIIQRCHNPSNKSYGNYGGRGIVVCQKWRNDFEAFLRDVGERPSRLHSLDRYPNKDGNYEPGNVRWATWGQQQRNRRNNVLIEYRGETKVLTDWAAQFGIAQQIIGWRLRHGWTPERAFNTPTPTSTLKKNVHN